MQTLQVLLGYPQSQDRGQPTRDDSQDGCLISRDVCLCRKIGEPDPCTHWMEGWVGVRASLAINILCGEGRLQIWSITLTI